MAIDIAPSQRNILCQIETNSTENKEIFIFTKLFDSHKKNITSFFWTITPQRLEMTKLVMSNARSTIQGVPIGSTAYRLMAISCSLQYQLMYCLLVPNSYCIEKICFDNRHDDY